MKKADPAFPGTLSKQGTLLMDARMIEQLADLMHDTAFFIKDASGRHLAGDYSPVERHGSRSSGLWGSRSLKAGGAVGAELITSSDCLRAVPAWSTPWPPSRQERTRS